MRVKANHTERQSQCTFHCASGRHVVIIPAHGVAIDSFLQFGSPFRHNAAFSTWPRATSILRLFPPHSPRGPEILFAPLRSGAVVFGRACGRQGVVGQGNPPAYRLSFCVHSGVSCFGHGRGRVFLVLWYYLGGVCCGVMRA